MTTQHPSLTRNNVQIVGHGKQVIIFAHGFGTEQSVWKLVAPAFADDYQLVLFDHVGSGGSDISAYSPHRYHTLHSYADDLLEIMTALDIRDAIYVGHSMSCMVGIIAADREPERFSRLVLLNCSPCYVNDADYFGGFEQAEVDGLHETMASNFYAWASGSAPFIMRNPERPELAQAFAEALTAMRPDIGVSISRMIYRTDVRELLPAIDMPVLVIFSRDDIVVPRQVCDYLVSRLPSAQLAEIDASGHLPHMSAPDAVISAIRAFLS